MISRTSFLYVTAATVCKSNVSASVQLQQLDRGARVAISSLHKSTIGKRFGYYLGGPDLVQKSGELGGRKSVSMSALNYTRLEKGILHLLPNHKGWVAGLNWVVTCSCSSHHGG